MRLGSNLRDVQAKSKHEIKNETKRKHERLAAGSEYMATIFDLAGSNPAPIEFVRVRLAIHDGISDQPSPDVLRFRFFFLTL